MEHITVSDEIMEKVTVREDDRKCLYRCLEMDVCPKCGEDLSSTIQHDLSTSYACKSCKFTIEK